MTKQQAIEIAKIRFQALCRARFEFDSFGGKEPIDPDYKHGWYNIGGYSISSDEFAPGPTYSGD